MIACVLSTPRPTATSISSLRPYDIIPSQLTENNDMLWHDSMSILCKVNDTKGEGSGIIQLLGEHHERESVIIATAFSDLI